MARTVRRVRVVGNPRRHKRNARKRRHNLSAKQIKYFGTPAQKAALKRSNRAKRQSTTRRKRHTRRTKRNVGEILSLTLPMANPPRKKARKARKARKTKGATTMAKAHRRRRRRANTGGTKRRTHRRRRTMAAHSHGHRRRSMYRANGRRRYNRRHRRHNAGGGMSFGGEVMDTLWLIGGAVGTGLLTQAVLGASNTGWIGYAGNGVAGFALSFLFSKVLKMPKAGKAMLKGAILQIVLRVIRDQTPFGQQLASAGLGDYVASNWVTPQIYADPNNSAMVTPPNGWGQGVVAAPAKGGMNGFNVVGDYNSGPGLYN